MFHARKTIPLKGGSEHQEHHKTSDSEFIETGLAHPIPTGKLVIENRGVPLAWTNDLPFVRVYPLALVKLRFGPSPLPLRIQKLATDCRIGVVEARQTPEQLVQEGDLIVECDHRGGGGTVWLPSGGDSRNEWKWVKRRLSLQEK